MKLFLKIALSLSCVIFVVMLACILLIYNYSQEILHKYIAENHSIVVNQIMAEIDKTMADNQTNIINFSKEKTFISIAQDADNNENLKQDAINRMQNIISLYPAWLKLAVIDKNGKITATSSNDASENFPVDPIEKQAVEIILSGKNYSSDLVKSGSTNAMAIIIGSPIQDSEQNTIGGIIGYYNWQSINILTAPVMDDFHIRLLNAEGVIIASNQLPENKINTIKEKYSPLVADFSNNVNDSTNSIITPEDNNDKKELITMAKSTYLSPNPWVLVLGAPISLIFAPAQKIALVLALMIIIIFILVADLMLFMIFKMIIYPINSLTLSAQKLSNGDFKARSMNKSNDEIGKLNTAFNEMADKLEDYYKNLEKKIQSRTMQLAAKVKQIKEKNNLLAQAKTATMRVLRDVEGERKKARREKEKIDVVIENIDDAVLILDTKGKIISLNKEGCKLLCYKNKDIIGKPYLEILKPQTIDNKILDENTAWGWKALRKGISVHNKLVTLSDSKNNRFIARISTSPLQQNRKIFGAVLIFRDVTREVAVDRQKTEFISIASHQLRTPLSAIKWFLEMLINGDAGKLKTEQADFLKEAYDSNERMIKLVNDLLNISRIEQGRVKIEPHPADLCEIAKSAIREAQPAYEKKHQKLAFKPCHLPKINIDSELIRQVIQNLISNAIKYTPESGSISITLKKSGKYAELSVKDSGFGIPDDQKSNIFKKFFRANNVISKETEGNGLGLYLAKSIIESSGGKMWFESKHHEGSTFYFTLPLSGSESKKGEIGLILS